MIFYNASIRLHEADCQGSQTGVKPAYYRGSRLLALLNCLQQKDIDAITVREILDRAEVRKHMMP